MFENHVYAGIPEALRQLRSDGWTLGVATSKPEHFANLILKHFGLDGFFDVVAGATMDGARRHKQDVIAHALAQVPWWTPGAGGIMVGDRDVDIDGGQAFGMHTIAVSWGYGSVEELQGSQPTTIVRTREELVSAIRACVAR